MDDDYKKAIEVSNLSQTFLIQKQHLKERIDAKLTYGYSNGIFKIDRSLITFVQLLHDKNRKENVILLDTNNTPVMITDLVEFLDEILDRYMSSTYEYYSHFEELKKTRSLEKLLTI